MDGTSKHNITHTSSLISQKSNITRNGMKYKYSDIENGKAIQKKIDKNLI